MPKFNPLWRPKPRVILSYGVAVLSVVAALLLAWWIESVWQSVPHVSLFFCAVMFSAWFGGIGPGLLATAISVLVFDYYFLPPIYSLALETRELPRLVFFALSALFVGSLSARQRSAAESLRDARDDLHRTVQELKRINEVLQAENAERKRAEDALRKSESYLAEAQKLSQTGSFGWNVSTGEIFWSEETHRIAGYDLATKPTVELIMQRIHPEDIVHVQETLDRASRGGTDLDFEHRFLMSDGSVKYVHVLAHAVRDKSGKIEYVGAAMDMTARRRAEGEQRKSEQKYRDLVDLSLDAIYVVDNEGNVVSANPAGLELLRCTAQDVAGMQVVETYLPEERAVSRARLDKLNGGASLQFERTFVRKDGTQVPVEVSASSMRHGFSQVVIRDISERKRAETKLRRSEAYLAEAQKLSRTGSWACSADLEHSTYWSAEMYRIMGFSERENPPSTEEMRKHLNADDLEKTFELFETIRRKKTTCDGEFPIRFPDGSERTFHIVGHPVMDEVGEIVEFVGTTIDVTEQRHARVELEKALAEIRKSEDRLRVIIDTIPTLAWSTQADGSVEFLSRGWLEYTGLSAEEARNWGWKVVLHHEDSAALMEKWLASIATGNPFEAEARFRRADGRYRWCLCRAVPVRDELGRIVQWYGTNTDIEDRKQAEEIRAAQARQAGVRADVSNALSKPAHWGEILRGCAEAIVRHLDAAFARIWTLNKERNMLELQASAGMYTHLDGPHGRIQVGQLKIGLIAEEKKPHLTNDVVNDPRVSDQAWARNEGIVSFAGYPLIVQDRVVGVVAMFARQPLSGVTLDTLSSVADSIAHGIERKRTEEALRKAQAELAHVTRVTTLGEMTASIAHEINQPLGAVVNNASACLRWLAASNQEEAQQSAALIVADAHRAGQIIGRIRAFVKKAPPQKAWLNINETILEVIALARSEVQGNRVSLETRLSDDVPLILGDRIQLQQVILNLINNAIEAMSGAGDGPRELQVGSAKDESQRVVVAVRDSGPGLDPKSLDHLFEAFYTTKPQGMGMGLAICRSIVEAHGGSLWATANDDRGATFQFTLPTGERTS